MFEGSSTEMTEKDKTSLFLASLKASPVAAGAPRASVPASAGMPRMDPLTAATTTTAATAAATTTTTTTTHTKTDMKEMGESSLSVTSTSSKKKEPRKGVVRRAFQGLGLLQGKNNNNSSNYSNYSNSSNNKKHASNTNTNMNAKMSTNAAPNEKTPLVGTKANKKTNKPKAKEAESIPVSIVSSKRNKQKQRRPVATFVNDSVHDNENPHNLQVRQRAQQGWQRIAHEVRNGDMLLRAAAIDPMQNTMSIDDKERERQKAQEWIRKGVEFNLWQCLLAMALYIGIAIFAFSFVLAEWTVIDSIYFAIVTFTTIGYGDLVPDSYISRVFTCFFALSGVACLGIALGVLGSNVMEAQEQALEQTKKMAQNRVLNLFTNGTDKAAHKHALGEDTDTDETTSPSTLGSDDANNDATQQMAGTKSHPFWHLLFHFCLVLVILVSFAFCVASDPGIDVDKVDIFDALYYTIITASTVGYGDFAPKTQHGRLLAIFFIPLSVGAMGHFLSSVAGVIMDSRRNSFQRQMDQNELSMQDLEIMDEDGDGFVTRAEYLEFMLVAMNKVDKEFIDQIRQSFARLDTDGTGTLSKEDMVAAARLKLRSPTKKLQLAQYKERLLLQAQQARNEAARTRKHRHRKTGSFWEDNFSFMNKAFVKNEEDAQGNDDSRRKHPLLS